MERFLSLLGVICFLFCAASAQINDDIICSFRTSCGDCVSVPAKVGLGAQDGPGKEVACGFCTFDRTCRYVKKADGFVNDFVILSRINSLCV